MRVVTAIVLVFLFTSFGLRDVFTLLNYYSNQEYIAEYLCVNKSQPELMCSGKCYLVSQLQIQDGATDDIPVAKLFEQLDLKFFSTKPVELSFWKEPEFKQTEWHLVRKYYYHNYYPKILEPPQRLSVIS